ncbi:thiamine-phosphate diphosphorylase [Veillonella denticariosi JCM 15641]|uniref:Multifunctional fusion protein n=1 Tax=Veillonella denticariosi JCM 15641 TaxID=1298594 RepID=A0A2S7ZCV5_9FIRM|nr:hydroxyethylthiazole kinase [Veillonella denticariosi]PQL21116.1 thiamine-phosphate diphosphorylase [Veillonella denticariosi JCM 15641]
MRKQENPYMGGRIWPELHILKELRTKNPLVICITNDVVKAFTANGLLAAGASPMMSECVDDLEDLIVHASAMLINIGTVTPDKFDYYKSALRLAKQHRVPVVLDPVGCHAGAYRLSVTMDLLRTQGISLLRGNQSEIKAVYEALCDDKHASLPGSGKGVDGGQVDDISSVTYNVSRLLHCPVVATGEIDYVSDGTRVYSVSHGHSLMTSVTGTGCLLGAVLAAFLSIARTVSSRFSQAEFLAYVLAYYDIAGERAAESCGMVPGNFSMAFIDELYTMDDTVLNEVDVMRSVVVPEQLKVYFICGTQDVGYRADTLLETVEDACRGGVTCFQYREKGSSTLSGSDKFLMSQKLKDICAAYNVLYIVNDDVELAVAVGADGVHVGQEDMNLESVRNHMGHKVVGISIHSREELKQTDICFADYAGIGPVYPTGSKADAQAPCGPARIGELQRAGLSLPIVGIGGITLDNAKEVLHGGAYGVAVISAIAGADDPCETAQQLTQIFKDK